MSGVNSAGIFQQTSRTILFEHFSDSDTCLDLARVLNVVGDDGRLTNQSREDLDRLTVKSFKEFVDRFAPPIYEIIHAPETDEAGNMIRPPFFEYTLDKERASKFFHSEKKLDKQLYYEMLLQIYRDKGNSRAADYEFDDSQILKMMTPKAEAEKLRRLRKQAEDNFARAYFANQKGENSTPFWDKYDAAMDEVQALADDKMVTIAQRLEDISVLMPAEETQGGSASTLPSGVAGYLAYDESGRLTFKAQEPIEQLPIDTQLASGKSPDEIKLLGAQQIRQDIEEEYNADVPEERRDRFALAVLQNTMAPLASENINSPALEHEKQGLETIYKDAREALAKALCPVAEKFVGVKAFFDQATNADGIFEPGLIVTNCSAARLLENDVQDKFKAFIVGQGRKQTDERIWLGILPAVQIGEATASTDMSHMSRAERRAAREQQQPTSEKMLTLQTAQTMLGILQEAQIMTCFNTREVRGKEAGFDSVTAQYLHDRKRDFKNMDFNRAVYAYPNFTIMRERNIKMDPAAGADATRIALPGAYVDAAYVAAGLLAASQQLKYLKEHGFRGRVNPQNVCVHVNLEDDEVRSRLVTRFNLADRQTWGDVEDEARGFGLALCGVPNRIDGREMVNTYVYSARTLNINSKNLYRRIDRVRLADFIDAYMRRTSVNSQDSFKEFQRKEVLSWKDEKNNSANIINVIMLEDENVALEGSNKVHVTFGEDMLPVTFEVKAKD